MLFIFFGFCGVVSLDQTVNNEYYVYVKQLVKTGFVERKWIFHQAVSFQYDSD